MAVIGHHTGSGRTSPLPASWGATHAPVAAGTRNATVTLRSASTTDWDPDANDGNGATVPTAGAAYASNVTARIQARDTDPGGTTEVADDTVTTPSYVISIDFDLAPKVGDEVEVTACPGDTALVGEFMRIDHVVHGTDRFSRDLYCTLRD